MIQGKEDMDRDFGKFSCSQEIHSALDSVREYVQAMREEGEADLRSVLSFIDKLKKNN